MTEEASVPAGEVAVAGRRARVLELVYRVGIIIKGIDGLIELVAGLLLWLAPGILRASLAPLMHTDSDDETLRLFIAQYAGRLDTTLAAGASAFVIVFLLTHGIVKLVLVYCLLKEYRWVYPYALAVLGLFAVYQIYTVIQKPTVGLIVLALLDIVIIWLVWREWRTLTQAAERTQPARPEFGASKPGIRE
ncbi:DUF2127 domain-containing protein [Subtercola frigoramans]|uniref:Membrane protein n=2 Tax=Subtercola frigoramans TaxID=120298 RepID=A0ABS2L0H6_9MICO|nr:DUF2127 domain-containing protein [Subtercola frigoramans]MBM7470578.1 putative membrane protein [Subtercola frigoramans]